MEKAVRKSAVQEGMVLVSAMHITAGVYVNDAEEGLIQDIDACLAKISALSGRLSTPPYGRNEWRLSSEKYFGSP